MRINVEKIMLKKVFKTNPPTEFEYIPQKEVTNMQLKIKNKIPIRPKFLLDHKLISFYS